MQIYTPKPRERAQEQIEAYILEQGLKVGDRLPPEREMCRMWGLNRTTLRSAIARLEAEGRLSSTQGSGTVLRLDFAGLFRICRVLPNMPLLEDSSLRPDCSLSPLWSVTNTSPGDSDGCLGKSFIEYLGCECLMECLYYWRLPLYR